MDVICSICIEFYSVTSQDYFITTPCGHIYHRFCLNPVFEEHGNSIRCPDCNSRVSLKSLIRLHQINPSRSNKIFKITVIGDAGTGKTCLSRRYTHDSFSHATPATIGQDYWFKTIKVGEETVRVQIWDTSGQERFKTYLTPQYVRNSQGVVLVYDTTCIKSLNSIKSWFDFANANGAQNAIKILVGAKGDVTKCQCIDYCRPPTEKEVEEVAQSLAVYYFVTSAKTALNVEIAFTNMAGQIFQNPFLLRQAQSLNQPGNVRLNGDQEGTRWYMKFRSC